MADIAHGSEPARAAFLNDPRIRGIIYQVLALAALIAVVFWIVNNTIENLRRANISSGFGFLNARSGFDIAQTLIPYSSNSIYIDAFIVGILNTLLVAVAGIITASIIGFIVGVGRLSRNWLIRKICMVYVEVFRNIPPLLVIFFWYLGVLSVLPLPRDSVELPFGVFLNSRGLFMPKAIWGDGAWLILLALVLGIVFSILVSRWSHARQMATGQLFPIFRTSAALIIGLPVLAYFAAGMPLTLDFPQQSTFNLTGGSTIRPEFLSLYLALSCYTASFIAEIVRAGIIGVSKGQTEAAYSLGVQPGKTLRLVVIPQALRIIIPPLTSQYLNLTKNSSLAVAVGYPDLVAVGQTAMNQTGQAIEVVAIWMVIYLGLSLSTSVFMNWFNARMALVER
ncbi:amino acid ABC transporter permease [Mesorhizobium sp. CAU 1732]|uniref:amino acid ABC transporter permease n=1 Tax=Mesorhizobium sp. CAU 1732 TaxID=3140358 RepID=UPI0032618C85